MSDNPTFSDGTPIFPMRAMTTDNAVVEQIRQRVLSNEIELVDESSLRWYIVSCRTLLDRLAAVEKARDAYMRGMIGQENRAIEFRKERDALKAKLAACEATLKASEHGECQSCGCTLHRCIVDMANIQQLEARLARSERALNDVEPELCARDGKPCVSCTLAAAIWGNLKQALNDTDKEA